MVVTVFYIKADYIVYILIHLPLINNNSLLNVRFGSLLGPRGLLLMYMWGENST